MDEKERKLVIPLRETRDFKLKSEVNKTFILQGTLLLGTSCKICFLYINVVTDPHKLPFQPASKRSNQPPNHICAVHLQDRTKSLASGYTLPTQAL